MWEQLMWEPQRIEKLKVSFCSGSRANGKPKSSACMCCRLPHSVSGHIRKHFLTQGVLNFSCHRKPYTCHTHLTSLFQEFLHERNQVQRELEALQDAADIARQFDQHLKGLAAMLLGNSWKLHYAWPSSGAVKFNEVSIFSEYGWLLPALPFQHSSFILQPRFNKLQFQHQHELPHSVLPTVEPPRISNFSCLGQDRCKNLLPWMPSKIVTN